MEEKLPITDFTKLNLQVGQISSVSDHPNADKLYILNVDLGEETERQIIAGLKNHYTKEELENKKAIFITNLQPAVLRGEESQGMILAAVSKDKKEVAFITPEKDIPIGTKIS